MTYAAIACAWIVSFINEMVLVFQTSAVMDGVCYGYVVVTQETILAISIYHFSLSYVFLLIVFIFCYGKILIVIRRQARVMAGHNPGGSVGHSNGGPAGDSSVDRSATIPVDQTPLRYSYMRCSPT